MVQAVLFDLIGTLVERLKKGRDEVFSDFLRQHGREVYCQEMAAAHDMVAFIDYPRGRVKNERDYCERILQRLELEYAPELLDEFEKACKEMNRFRLYPDVKPVMAELGKRGIKTAIVTTGRRFEFEPFLEENGLHFDFISTGRESGAAKPNPRCYLTALEGLGVKAEDALMVGDEPDLDVAAPKQLGMMGILLCRNGKSDYGNADGMISSLSELVRFL